MKVGRLYRNAGILLAGAAVCSAGGCSSLPFGNGGQGKYFRPTVGVMSLQNRAPAQTRWNLGDELADQLIDRLLQTQPYVVLERPQLQAALARYRPAAGQAGKAAAGPEAASASQVRYLVKGTITDFGHVDDGGGLSKFIDGTLRGGSGYATIAVTLYVVDLQSGQVIASERIEGRALDRPAAERPKYDAMAFGSFTFYRTPLGQATTQVLDGAVRLIARAVAEQPYQPKIASVVGGRVVVNGGRDRKLRVGDEYLVRPAPQVVLDPDSGNLLGHVTGQIIGRVRVTQVTEKFAIAEVLEGSQFQPGQALFGAQADGSKPPAAPSSY